VELVSDVFQENIQCDVQLGHKFKLSLGRRKTTENLDIHIHIYVYMYGRKQDITHIF
jgi:hypothetical protein